MSTPVITLCNIMETVAKRTSQLDHIPHFVTLSALFVARSLLSRTQHEEAKTEDDMHMLQATHLVHAIVPLLDRRRVVYKQLLWAVHAAMIFVLEHAALTPGEYSEGLTYQEGLAFLFRTTE